MRSPSGTPSGSDRGDAPVAMSSTSACTVSPAASIVRGPVSCPLAWMIRTPSAVTCSAMSFDCAAARALIRAFSAGASTSTTGLAPSASCRPSEAERPSEVMVDDDSISVLLGTQSVRTQAPPRPSSSMTVTSAPSCAATSAAS